MDLSIIVVSCAQRFYERKDLKGHYRDLRPGYYRWVVDAGIPNDIISSFQCIVLKRRKRADGRNGVHSSRHSFVSAVASPSGS